MKIKKITVQLDDGTVDHAFDHSVEAGYDLGTHVSDNFEFLLNSIGYRKQIEGEWLVKWRSTFPQYEPSEYECSNCGYRRTVLHKFCPNCGSKMKGGAE